MPHDELSGWEVGIFAMQAPLTFSRSENWESMICDFFGNAVGFYREKLARWWWKICSFCGSSVRIFCLLYSTRESTD